MTSAWGDHRPGPATDCPVCNPGRCDCPRHNTAPGGGYRGPARAIVLLLVCAAVLVGLWAFARWPW